MIVVVTGITREELAHRAGVAVDDIDRLVDIGIITPGEGLTFSGGDVWRARFLLGLDEGGVPLQAVARRSGAETSRSSSSMPPTGIASAA